MLGMFNKMNFTVTPKSKGNQENSGGCVMHIAVVGLVKVYTGKTRRRRQIPLEHK